MTRGSQAPGGLGDDVFAHDLHLALAWTTALGMFGVAVEAALRIVRRQPPGRLAEVGLGLSLVLVGMTAAAGLAMLVRSDRPSEGLHFLYAILAFGLVPVADSVAANASPRRRALARLAGAVIALGIVARLFATG
jgi:hypothetical protein